MSYRTTRRIIAAVAAVSMLALAASAYVVAEIIDALRDTYGP